MGNSSSKQKPVKATKTPKVKKDQRAKGPGHTLGGGSTSGGSPSSGQKTSTNEARSAAAEAAAARLEKKNTGQLGAKLDQQRAKSNTQHLKDASAENTASRNEPLVYD